MERILNLSARFPWLILSIIVAITYFAAMQLSNLRIEVSAESLIVEDDPAWIAQKVNVSKFGNSQVTVVLFRDEALFTREKLSQIQKAIDELSSLDEVSNTTSMFSVANIKMIDEYIVAKPYIDKIPETDAELQEILKQAQINPILINNLISEAGDSFAINLILNEENKLPDFDSKVSQSIETILAKYRTEIDSITQIGTPYIRTAITQKIAEDQRTIMPWSVALLVLALAIGMGSFSGALIPLFTAVVSITWTLAGMALMDIPIGVMTSIVPALLIIIGSTEDIHIISEHKANLAQGMEPSEALSQMSKTIGVAILLTFITTYFGFISIYTNEIQLLKEFGLVASSGLLINFLVTSLTVPAILKIFSSNKKKSHQEVHAEDSIYAKFALWIFDSVLKHKTLTIIMLIFVSLWAVSGAVNLKVNNNPLSYFKSDTDIVKNSNLLHENLAGIETFSIILETGIEDTFKKVRYLEEIETIQKYLEANYHFDKSLSFGDFMKVINLAMEGEEAETLDDLYLPDSDGLIREYLLFVKHDLFSSYVTEDYSSARILVRHAIESSNDLKQAIFELEQFIKENIDPALKVSVTGNSIVNANAADYMAAGQAKSLLFMSLVIMAVVSLLFVTWKAGLVALLPNLFPIVVLFGVMGHLGIALDTGTSMVAVIALGICVDDTVHFMSRYHHKSRNRADPLGALRETVVDESVPIFTTSLALMVGFATFAFSSFVPIVYFGLLSAMVMFLALVTTFIVTPLLLSFMRLVTMWDMLSLKLQVQVIDSCPLFKDMNTWSIKKTILASDVRYYHEGENIIKQGDVGDDMFVILEGDVAVKIKQGDGSVSTVGVLSEGSLFGEIALVSKVPRTASIFSKSNSRLLSLKLENIERLSRYNTRIASKLYRNLAAIIGKRLSQVDNLTIMRDETSGYVSRSFIEELIELEIFKSQRYKEPLSFICFTLLFELEDEVFDGLLGKLSEQLREDTRNVDMYARWNDKRFVVLLPRTSPENCDVVASRIKTHTTEILSTYQQENNYTVSYWSYDGVDSIESIAKTNDEILNENIEKI